METEKAIIVKLGQMLEYCYYDIQFPQQERLLTPVVVRSNNITVRL